jgi:hypothetical protein
VARGHARLGYAGGSWWTSWPVRLGAAVRVEVLDRDPATRGYVEFGNRWERKHRGNNGHVPAAWTSRLLTMVFQSAVAIVDSVFMDRSVRMNVRNDMALCMLMKRMLLTVAMMVTAVPACCGLREEGPLNSKRQRGRYHHDVGAPSKRAPRNRAQLKNS